MRQAGCESASCLGLKWEDVDFESLEVNVTRSVVKQKITRCKTEASRKPIPLDADLAEVLLTWRLQCPYPQAGDWVFASPHKKGKQPYWPGSLFRAHLKPALEGSGDSWQRGMAYAAAHVRHFDESQWRGHQDDSGAVAPCKLQGDGGYLHPGSDTNQTRGTNQIGENDFAGRRQKWARSEGQFFLLDPFEPSAQMPIFR